MRVVIAGAGVVGASIAFHLTRRGVRDVVVLDRGEQLGAGSTSRATGGFRLQFSTKVDIRLSLLSREKLLRFREEVGGDPGYEQHGYLFLARSPEVLDVLRTANALQRACGVTEAALIPPDEARRINPAIGDDSLAGGAFCSADGFIRAMQMLPAYAAAAERGGARFRFGVAVRGVNATGFITDDGVVEGDVLVNAAGAWASEISAVAVRPLRRQVAATVPTERLPPSMPMTIWTDDGYHARVREGRALLLWPQDVPYGFDTAFDESWLPQVEQMTRERLPPLRDVAIDRAASWAGLYEMSPDRHAIVGWSPEQENLFLATGSSGHGVMHSPAIGEIAAALIVGEKPPFDVAALRPSRFAENDAIVSSELL